MTSDTVDNKSGIKSDRKELVKRYITKTIEIVK